MSTPYRKLAGTEVHEAPTRDGTARLEMGPRHAQLEIPGVFHLSITDSWLTFVKEERRRKPKKRSMSLEKDARLVVARAVPTEDVALWYEGEPGIQFRVVGLRPVELLVESALADWRLLDRLAAGLARAVHDSAGGAIGAHEFGNGHHRVLLIEYPDRVVLFARPLFRERPRRLLEVRRDGRVQVKHKEKYHRVKTDSRYAVTLLGDRIRFESARGRDVASVWLPWISVEERTELCRRLGEVVDQSGVPANKLLPSAASDWLEPTKTGLIQRQSVSETEADSTDSRELLALTPTDPVLP